MPMIDPLLAPPPSLECTVYIKTTWRYRKNLAMKTTSHTHNREEEHIHCRDFLKMPMIDPLLAPAPSPECTVYIKTAWQTKKTLP
jgi:hypothetical protein